MLVVVAAGGALGALGRYWVMDQVGNWMGHAFPWGTLAVNVVGCFLLGAVVELSALAWSPTAEMPAFLTVGLLGAFTTFSAYSVEAYLMAERGQWELAALYVAVSVLLAVGGLFAGLHLFRAILA